MTTENIREYIALLDIQIESAEKLRAVIQHYCKHQETMYFREVRSCKICGKTLETA